MSTPGVVRQISVFYEARSRFAVPKWLAEQTAHQAAARVSRHLGGTILTRSALGARFPEDMNPIDPDNVNFRGHPHSLFYTRRWAGRAVGTAATAGRTDLRTGVALSTKTIVTAHEIDITGMTALGDTARALATGFGAAACGNQCVMNGSNSLAVFAVMNPETTFCRPCGNAIAAGGEAALAYQTVQS